MGWKDCDEAGIKTNRPTTMSELIVKPLKSTSSDGGMPDQDSGWIGYFFTVPLFDVHSKPNEKVLNARMMYQLQGKV